MKRADKGASSAVISRVRARVGAKTASERILKANDRCMESLYEKLYFHELDSRDKLYYRLQVPMAVLISMVGFLGFMLQNLQRGQVGVGAFCFWASFCLATFFICVSGVHLKNATWGNEYAVLPVAKAWDEYRVTCDQLYEKFEDRAYLTEEALRDGIYRDYIKCASFNAEINDKRSFSIYLAIKHLIAAVVSVFLAFVFFYFGDLDKSAKSRPVEVTVVSPIEMRGPILATDKPAPPPPPAPPPTRFVRDNRPPPPQQPSKQNGK